MKISKPKLAVVDLDPHLNSEICAAFEKVAASARERVVGVMLVYDWRDVAVRYLRRRFPQFWIYRGGRHIAIHASPPPEARGGRTGRDDHEAGRCLARITEAGR